MNPIKPWMRNILIGISIFTFAMAISMALTMRTQQADLHAISERQRDAIPMIENGLSRIERKLEQLEQRLGEEEGTNALPEGQSENGRSGT